MALKFQVIIHDTHVDVYLFDFELSPNTHERAIMAPSDITTEDSWLLCRLAEQFFRHEGTPQAQSMVTFCGDNLWTIRVRTPCRVTRRWVTRRLHRAAWASGRLARVDLPKQHS